MENLVNGNFDVHIQWFIIVAAFLSWRNGQVLEIRWTFELGWCIAILSQTILRISESILGLVFNQMGDDAEFALETPVCCLLPIPHVPLKPFVK